MSSCPIQSVDQRPLSQDEKFEAMLSPTCSDSILNRLKMEMAATKERMQNLGNVSEEEALKNLRRTVSLDKSDLPPLRIFLK